MRRESLMHANGIEARVARSCCSSAGSRLAHGAAQDTAAGSTCQRLPLPPDELRAGRDRHPRLPEDHGRQGRPRRALRHPAAADRGPTRNTGDYAPTYYLQTDAPLYYYSFTDAFIAMAYRSLPPSSRRASTR